MKALSKLTLPVASTPALTPAQRAAARVQEQGRVKFTLDLPRAAHRVLRMAMIDATVADVFDRLLAAHQADPRAFDQYLASGATRRHVNWPSRIQRDKVLRDLVRGAEVLRPVEQPAALQSTSAMLTPQTIQRLQELAVAHELPLGWVIAGLLAGY